MRNRSVRSLVEERRLFESDGIFVAPQTLGVAKGFVVVPLRGKQPQGCQPARRAPTSKPQAASGVLGTIQTTARPERAGPPSQPGFSWNNGVMPFQGDGIFVASRSLGVAQGCVVVPLRGKQPQGSKPEGLLHRSLRQRLGFRDSFRRPCGVIAADLPARRALTSQPQATSGVLGKANHRSP